MLAPKSPLETTESYKQVINADEQTCEKKARSKLKSVFCL